MLLAMRESRHGMKLKKGPAIRRPFIINYALRVRTTQHPAQWS